MIRFFVFILLVIILPACGNTETQKPPINNDSTFLDSFTNEPIIDSFKIDTSKLPKIIIDSTDSSGTTLKQRLSADSSIKLPSTTKDDLKQALEYMKQKQGE